MRAGPAIRTLGIATLLAVAGLGAVATVVAAHAELLSTDPPDGTVLERPPSRIELTFSEPVAIDRSTFDLIDGSGRPLTTGPAAWIGGDHGRVVIPLPAMADDAFRLAWRTVSEADLHVAAGTIVFGVAASPGASASTPDGSPQLDEAASAAVGSMGFVVLVGSVAVWLGLLPGRRPGELPGQEATSLVAHLRRRILAIGIGSALLAGVADIAVAVVRLLGTGGPAGAGTPWTMLLDSGFGTRAVLSTALLIAVASEMSIQRRWSGDGGPRGGSRAQLVPALVVAIALVRVLGSHPAAAAPVSPLAIAAAWVHSLASGVWIGGLVVLAFVVAPVLRRGPTAGELAIWVLRGFAPIAVASVVALAVSGLVLAGRVVASIDALLFSTYGVLLLLKVGLAAAVGAIGVLNHVALRPATLERIRAAATAMGWRSRQGPMAIGGRSPLRRTLAIEATGAAAVVVIAGLLAGSTPAIGSEWSPRAASGTTARVLADQVDDLLVTFTIRPNRPGRNFVSVGVHDTRRPAPAPIGRVEARLDVGGPAATDGGRPGIRTDLQPIGDGRLEVAVDLPAREAAFPAVISVTRSGLPTVRYETGWTLFAPEPPSRLRPTIVSSQPLRPLLDGLAGLLIAVLAAAVLVSRVMRGASRLDRAGGREALVAGAAGRPPGVSP